MTLSGNNFFLLWPNSYLSHYYIHIKTEGIWKNHYINSELYSESNISNTANCHWSLHYFHKRSDVKQQTSRPHIKYPKNENQTRMKEKGRKEETLLSGVDGSLAPIVQAERLFRCVISLFLILYDRETKLFDVLYMKRELHGYCLPGISTSIMFYISLCI